MPDYRGITWDHPRGYAALRAAADQARAQGLDICWDRQPLEGFESRPIRDLCADYDLVVLDHPHVGEAVAGRCLQPLEAVFGPEFVRDIAVATIGPCFSSYAYDGSHWALPVDAASQVLAMREDLLDGDGPPRTWGEVTGIARERPGQVALSVAGPHALLCFMSIATALGEPPATRDSLEFIGLATGRQVLGILRELWALMPAEAVGLNPIGILERMSSGDDWALCPLVYGYVNYAAPARGRGLRFSDAPSATRGGRPGSTLGGTGIGISTRCAVDEALRRHLEWLLGPEAQTTFIPAHEGQPSARAAWHDAAVNRAHGDFYRGTLQTLEAAYVRPRHAGYPAFQSAGSALIRSGLADGTADDRLLGALQDLYEASRHHAGGT
jgi:multiple sugar transport system substrate-binding protein